MIPHGAFEHLAARAAARAAVPPPSSPATDGAPVVLCFGLMRPYKGIDLLLDAWGGPRRRRAVDRGHAAHGHLARCAPARPRACASSSASSPTSELPALFRRAELVVLPYRETEPRGAVHRAGVRQAAAAQRRRRLRRARRHRRRARWSPPGDPEALRAALEELLADGASGSG